MAKLVYQVLEEVRKKRSKKEKIEILKANESWPLKDVIRGSMDPTIEWNLPPGEPPYTAAEAHNAPANLLRENKKFGYFIKVVQVINYLPLKEKISLWVLLKVYTQMMLNL